MADSSTGIKYGEDTVLHRASLIVLSPMSVGELAYYFLHKVIVVRFSTIGKDGGSIRRILLDLSAWIWILSILPTYLGTYLASSWVI